MTSYPVTDSLVRQKDSDNCVKKINHPPRRLYDLDRHFRNDNPNYSEFRHGQWIKSGSVAQFYLETEERNEIVESEVPTEDLPVLNLENNNNEINVRVRRAAGTFYHVAWTANMGTVVDAECRVLGVKGLRVCDASVLLANVEAHLQVVVYAIGERVADLS